MTGIDLGMAAAAASLPAFIVIISVSALAWVGRPWELRGGSLLDRIRVVEAVNNYDFWLSLRGVSGRRRRDLRDELRANLWDATLRIGSKAAVAAVGSTRKLAAGSVAENSGPHWGRGLFAGLVAVESVVMLQVFVATVWADAADAAQVTRLSGGVTLVPGMRVEFEHTAERLAFDLSLGPISLVIGGLVFLAVAQPWRLVARRADRQQMAS